MIQPTLPEIESIEKAGGVAIETTPDSDWVLVAFGRAWVSDSQEGVYSFDARTGRALGTVRLSRPCASMDEGFGSVWTLTCGPTGVARIDPVERKVTVGSTCPSAMMVNTVWVPAKEPCGRSRTGMTVCVAWWRASTRRR